METCLTQITNYLLTQSWQIAVLVVVVAAATFALRNKSAHIRYLLWLIVLAKCLTPPLLEVPVAVLPEKAPAPAFVPTPMPTIAEAPAETPRLIKPAPVAAPVVSSRPQLSTRQWLAIGWMIGAAALACIAAVKACRTIRWLHRDRRPLSAGIQNGVNDLLSSLSLRRLPKMWLIEGIGQPFVWGALRGDIYLPGSFVRIPDDEHRKHVLGHELSHIMRFDAAVNLIQTIAQAILWFHPFVWWANKKIRAEREKCCDEMAIARLNAQAKDYSRAIVETLVTEYESTRPVPSLAVAGPVKNIEERIKTMLRPGKRFYKHPSLVAVVVVMLIAILTVPTALVLTARAGTTGATENEAKPTKSLHQAAADGDIERVKLLLAKGFDVNAKDEEGDSALHIAAEHCHVELAEVLLDGGADVNARDRIAHTPLHWVGGALWLSDYGGRPNATAGTARETRIRKMAEVLIAKGADVNAAYPGGGSWTPLHYAVRDGRKNFAELLIRNGADLNARNRAGMTPVDCAFFMATPGRARGARQAAELLVTEGADVSAIHWAAFIGDLAKIQESLGKGVDVNVRDARMKATPLLFAASGGQKNVIQFLIDEGADVGAKAKWATPLYVAVWSGEKDVAELLIEKGADVNRQGLFGTPLHVAAIFRQVDMAKLLIANGANVNGAAEVVGPLSATPLQTALVGAIVIDFGAGWPPSRLGQFTGLSDLLPTADGGLPAHVSKQRKALLELLLSAGAYAKTVFPDTMHVLARLDAHEIAEPLIAHGLDVNTKYKGATALHTAAEYGSEGMIKLLVANGADLNVQDNQGRTPLSLAKEKGRKEIIELLHKHGAKDSSSDQARAKPAKSLHEAASKGDLKQVKELLAAGAAINAKDIDGNTPLHHAAKAGHREIVMLLIDDGADINAPGRWTARPLHAAAWEGHVEIVKQLIARGADVNAWQNDSWTPLHSAADQGHKEVAEILIASGVDVDARQEGGTPLDTAAGQGRVEMAAYLIDKGADVNAKNSWGGTPLMEATGNGHVALAKVLVEKGADLDARDEYGWTALHRAASNIRNMVSVEFLVAEGANVNSKDNNGETPADSAFDSSAPYSNKIVKLLVEKGAAISKLEGVYLAAYLGDLSKVKDYLNQGKDVNATNKGGKTLLHIAALAGEGEILEFLIANGADLNMKDNDGSSALDYAQCHQHFGIARLLKAKGAVRTVPKGWYRRGSHPKDYAMTVDRSESHNGQASAQISCTGNNAPGFGTLLQSFRADDYRGKRVNMTVWMKTRQVNKAQLWMRLDGVKKMLDIDNMGDRPVKGTTGWNKYEIALDVPQNTVGVYFGALVSGAGQVWVDDFTFTVIEEHIPAAKMVTREQLNAERGDLERKSRAYPRQPVNLDFEDPGQ